MKTKLGLLQRDAAEIVVRDISGIEMALIASGVLFWTLLLFAAVRFFVLKWIERDLDEDIPAFMQGEHFQRNATNTLSFSEMRAIELKHPSVATSIRKATKGTNDGN